jgi:hypothetical protein
VSIKWKNAVIKGLAFPMEHKVLLEEMLCKQRVGFDELSLRNKKSAG